MSGRGIIYVATGAAHVAAARLSAASARRTNPGLGIAIFCDDPAPGAEFDQVTLVTNPHARSKIDYLAETPFAETLYLDGDTRVMADLGEMFRLMERFDLAAAHRAREPERVLTPAGPGSVPSSFPEHNGGVLLYRMNGRVTEFLRAWQGAYHRLAKSADQISFRESLWASDIRLTVLPPRFNTRKYTWADHWFSSRPKPVILHLNRFHPSKHGRFERLLGPGA